MLKLHKQGRDVIHLKHYRLGNQQASPDCLAKSISLHRKRVEMAVFSRLVTWLGLVALMNLDAVAGQPAEVPHRLGPTPRTITWGYFDPRTPAVLRVRSGDTVEIESLIAVTVDALEAAGLSRDNIQPALLEIDRQVKDRGEIPHILTGPIWVEGAEPGDVLEVKIISIQPVVPYAVNFFGPGLGFLPSDFPYSRYKVTPLDLKRQVAKFSESVEIPIRPFFGVIGVAPPPETGRISSGPPWIHTGNMDNKELGAGTTLFLPVHVAGGLLSVGDGHAGQGDGEVCVTALETSLRGTFQLSVRKGLKLRWPRAETSTCYMTMGFHENLEEATRIAVVEMLDFLVSEKHLSRDEAYILASDVMDLRITQLVDGKKGVHALLPKNVFVQ
jgi:acetamidase/formamidase